jgi:hypothetical protein
MARRESRYASATDVKRIAPCDLDGAVRSLFPKSAVYAAVFEAMVNWTRRVKLPSPGSWISTIGDTDEIRRDERGNALGGVRTLYTDAPVSRLIAANPWDASPGTEVSLVAERAAYAGRIGASVQL